MQWAWLKNTNLPTRAKWQIDGWFSGPRRDVVGTLGARNALLHWRKWEWNMMMIGLLRCDERYWPDEVWMMILNCSSSLAWTREVSRKRASYGIFVGFLWSMCNNAEYLGRFVSKQLCYMDQNFRQIARRSNSAVIQYQAITRFMCISQIRNVHLPERIPGIEPSFWAEYFLITSFQGILRVIVKVRASVSFHRNSWKQNSAVERRVIFIAFQWERWFHRARCIAAAVVLLWAGIASWK